MGLSSTDPPTLSYYLHFILNLILMILDWLFLFDFIVSQCDQMCFIMIMLRSYWVFYCFYCGFFGAFMSGALDQMNFSVWDNKVDLNLNLNHSLTFTAKFDQIHFSQSSSNLWRKCKAFLDKSICQMTKCKCKMIKGKHLFVPWQTTLSCLKVHEIRKHLHGCFRR